MHTADCGIGVFYAADDLKFRQTILTGIFVDWHSCLLLLIVESFNKILSYSMIEVNWMHFLWTSPVLISDLIHPIWQAFTRLVVENTAFV